MALWRREPLEEVFWQDNTTRDFLLWADRSFWMVCSVNVLIDVLVTRTFSVGSRSAFFVVVAVYWGAAVLVAVISHRNPVGYYRQRGKVMFLNRAVRIVFYALYTICTDQGAVMKWNITDRLASGRQANWIFWGILSWSCHLNLPWTMYFPLPSRKGIWLDIIQQGFRLVASVVPCTELLGVLALKPAVTAKCKAVNMLPATLHLLSRAEMAMMDRQCDENGPILLSLFTRWFVGCFWPTFSVWYVETRMREDFISRQRGAGANGRGGFWGLYFYIIANLLVASVSWQLLHVLLMDEERRNIILRVLHFKFSPR